MLQSVAGESPMGLMETAGSPSPSNGIDVERLQERDLNVIAPLSFRRQ